MTTGVAVTSIRRGDETITDPDGAQPLRGGDTVVLSGTAAALDAAESALLDHPAAD